MTPDTGRIRELADSLSSQLVSWRRHLHMHPELSTQEQGTSAFIQKILSEYGIAYTAGIADTGVVGIVRGNLSGEACIALRADMDALPILEANDVPYRSQNSGVMHACGHDAHTTSLLGTAIILQENREHFAGSVKLIFQPSEEKYPGGAIRMIQEGVLENPRPSYIFGQHVLPTLNAGMAGFRPGRAMASTDEIHLTVIGKGGHGATPELTIDPVSIAAQIIVSLQQLVSRMASPVMPTVLTFGRVIADGQTNIIPDSVEMHGILRTFDESWRVEARQKITTIAQGIASAFGARCEVFIDPGYPYLVNDESLTRNAIKWAKEYLGEEYVTEIPQRMTAEDFAYFSHAIPSCFYRLGIRNEEKGIVSNLHTPTFDIDEDALTSGTGLMAYLALKALENLSGNSPG
jgi:amidohydrolase